jgi:DNA primase
MKYVIKAKIEVDGMVDKPDIIGAVFGQTEGLFGPDFDLRELQDKGRIGRIAVDIKHHGGKTIGEILLPSNLDKAETALVAAMLEFVDKVGPFNAKIKVTDIVDLRQEKIKKIAERAKELLQQWFKERSVDVKEILYDIEASVKTGEVIRYGPEGLVAGPEVEKSDTLIIVEGRADVINLLRYGYKNAIAIEGAKGKIPDSVIQLSKRKKKVIAFLDGDHAGDLILKELLRVAKVDYVARAPPGREVEELTGKEIMKALKNAVPVKELVQQTPPSPPSAKQVAVTVPETGVTPQAEYVETLKIPSSVLNDIQSLRGTLEAIVYDSSWKPLERVPVRDIVDYILNADKEIYAVVMDGIITQRVVDAAAVKGVKALVGARIATITKKPTDIIMLSFDDLVQ